MWERRDLDVDVLNDYGYLLKDLFELKTDGVKCINLINLNRGNVGSSSLIVELASLKKCISAMCDTLFVLMSSTLAFKSSMLLFKYLSRIILNRNE